ncbi:MAG: 16S rRNA (guanine(966)-N(2))-methyltransferase [Enterobacteriaceae bacterium]
MKTPLSSAGRRAQAGQIRIIAGQWRGRKLPVLNRPGLRPTTDRIKETLFNWLAPVLSESRCQDCFAGSGSLGFEALSRYAAEAVMLESDAGLVQQLNDNLRRLAVTQGRVIHTDALQWLAQPGTPFDVIFVDPPFRQGLLAETLRLLEHNHWLAEEAWIYVEAEAEQMDLAVPERWRLHRQKVAGQVAYRLYQRIVTETEE